MDKKPRINQKQYPKDAPIPVYLGKGDEKKRRKALIDELAERYGNGKISRLIQRIADGELEVRPKASA